LQRLHFAIPTTAQAEAIVDEFHRLGIGDENIHTIAKDQALTQNLPKAGILEESDFVPALRRGVVLGAAVGGVLGGLVAILLPPSLFVGAGALLIGILAGAGFGAWSSAMVGSSVTNTHLQEHQASLDRGEILLLVDVGTEQQMETVSQIVHKHDPNVRISHHEPEARSSHELPQAPANS